MDSGSDKNLSPKLNELLVVEDAVVPPPNTRNTYFSVTSMCMNYRRVVKYKESQSIIKSIQHKIHYYLYQVYLSKELQ